MVCLCNDYDKERSDHRLIRNRVFSLNYLLINLLTQFKKKKKSQTPTFETVELKTNLNVWL